MMARDNSVGRRNPVAAVLALFMVLCAIGGGLTSCGTAPRPLELSKDIAVPGSKIVEIMVATTRHGDGLKRGDFSPDKADALNFAIYRVSIPPKHQTGLIEDPGKRADPAKTFAVIGYRALSAAEFAAAIAPDKARGSDVAVFVHGYNTGFRDALFRAAQIHQDSGFAGKFVLFSWPSLGEISGYVADRDAAAYSRPYLANLLEQMGKGRGEGNVNIFAHSMGCWLTVEALRDLKMSGRLGALSKPHVVLAAPDIDYDVFRSQIRIIGPLDPPIIVLVSADDRALYASRRLSGDHVRLGAVDVNDPAVQKEAQDGALKIIDISGINSNDHVNHDRFVNFAASYPRLADKKTLGKELRKTGVFIFDALATTVSSPFKIVSNAL